MTDTTMWLRSQISLNILSLIHEVDNSGNSDDLSQESAEEVYSWSDTQTPPSYLVFYSLNIFTNLAAIKNREMWLKGLLIINGIFWIN